MLIDSFCSKSANDSYDSRVARAEADLKAAQAQADTAYDDCVNPFSQNPNTRGKCYQRALQDHGNDVDALAACL